MIASYLQPTHSAASSSSDLPRSGRVKDPIEAGSLLTIGRVVVDFGSAAPDLPCGVDRELTVRAEPRAALYSSLRLLYFAAIILWVGGGFSLPVVADIRRTVALGRAHGSALHARLVTATRLVVPAAVVALLTGVALIQLRGGFGAVPSLMTDFDS